jgi:hypothetical protein
MIEHKQKLDPEVRQLLIQSRCLAMRGELPRALADLDALTATETRKGRGLEKLFTAMLRVELLHLDDQDEECIKLFDSVIMPGLEGLPMEVVIIAGYNRQEGLMALFRPIEDFHSLVAQARAMGFELSDANMLLSAETYAARGDHFKALPAFWQEVVRTFRQGCWKASRWATTRLARECLQVGFPHEAAWYAVLSLDEELARQAAQALLDRRDVGAIRQTLERLMANANLQRHFSIACEIIARAADGIPDDLVGQVEAWLLRRCTLPASPRLAQGALPMAWTAVAALSARLSTVQAQEVVRTAVNHPAWLAPISGPDSVVLVREAIVKALTPLVHALPVADLGLLAENVLPLATDRRVNHDYVAVVNLLCEIAGRADEPVKRQLGDRLFVPGRVPFLLGQVASLFGKDFLSPEDLERAVQQVRSMIVLQVQRLPSGVEPQPYPERLGSFHSPLGDGSIVVSFASGVALEAIARHRQALEEESLNTLIRTVLTMIGERENFLVNRVSLIRALATFSDRLRGELLTAVIAVLAPLARGEIEEPTITPAAAEAEDPLNPRKISHGRPAQVRGAALITLAEIEALTSGVPQALLEPLLDEALSDLDPEVRRAAFAAARALPRLSEEAMMAVLQGLRDPDPNSAAMAFDVLATKPDLRLTRPQWRLFLYAAKMASQSSAPLLRAAAAKALAKLLPSAPSEGLRDKAAELQTTFTSDISATVRHVARAMPLASNG